MHKMKNLLKFLKKKKNLSAILIALAFIILALMRACSAEIDEKLQEQNQSTNPTLYEQGQILSNDKEDENALKTQCNKAQKASACSELGKFYDKDKKHSMAMYYYKRACDLNFNCKDLGQIYLFAKSVGGVRVKADVKRARQYFIRACKGGAQELCFVKNLSVEQMAKRLDEGAFKF